MNATVLLVDPDDAERARFTGLLETQLKAKVVGLRTAREAIIELNKGLDVGLIVSAQEPADGDAPIYGADVCRAAAAIHGPGAGPPVVLTVEENTRLMPAYQAGATDVLLKPFRDASLLSKAHMCLRTPRPSSGMGPRRLTSGAFQIAARLRSLCEEGGWYFGPYLLLDELGRGGIGVVAKALNMETGELSAIKLLLPDHVDDDEWFSRFRREGRILTDLWHPNLCTTRAIGTVADIHYIAMEFVVGTALNQVCDRDGPFTEEQAMDIMAQIARGLQVLADNAIVHRDIKPENVMVNDEGHAWLIDFGLSKRAGDVQLTQEGEILGTVAFIAPETISGAEPDICSDIYALGVTLYEILTGEDLLASRTTREIFLDALRGKTVDKARGGVSEKAAAIIERMMAVSPRDRYSSPEALLQDIRRHYPESWEAHRHLLEQARPGSEADEDESEPVAEA